MKKTFLLAVVSGILLVISSGTASAVGSIDVTGTMSRERFKEAVEEKTEAMTTQIKESQLDKRSENLKERALKEIGRRTESLNNVSKRIAEIKKLTDSQKALLSSNLQTQIDLLNTLNTKIQNDTDIETLKADVKSITEAYRIYLLYLPSTRIIISANGVITTAEKFSEIAGKLQTRIDEAKIKGVNTEAMETLLTEMKTKITDAKAKATEAISMASALQPTEFPGNKTNLQNARQKLVSALKDINDARKDSQKILVLLRKSDKLTPTAANSGATATPTPAAEPSATPSE